MYVEHWSENLVTSKRMNFKGEVTRDNKVPEQIGEDEVGNTGKGTDTGQEKGQLFSYRRIPVNKCRWNEKNEKSQLEYQRNNCRQDSLMNAKIIE